MPDRSNMRLIIDPHHPTWTAKRALMPNDALSYHKIDYLTVGVIFHTRAVILTVFYLSGA